MDKEKTTPSEKKSALEAIRAQFKGTDTHPQCARLLPAAASTTGVALVRVASEPRIDSRLLAQQLNNQHRAVVALIDRYADDIRRHGQLTFQKAVGERQQGGGNAERYALLNEDQSFFVLALSRNTDRVVALKSRLVTAFREARWAAEMRSEYLPGYHQLHDAMAALAKDSTHPHFVHMNINRLVNKVAGVEAGTRDRVGVPQQAMLITAQLLAAGAVQGSADHRDAYARVKAALEPLSGALPMGAA